MHVSGYGAFHRDQCRAGGTRVADQREVNVRLAEFVVRVGWSRKELARRVNQRAKTRGVHLGTDASRVRHWLEGQHPQPPVPEVLSELFSERLGYPVLPAELGLPAVPEHGLGLWYAESVAATVVALAELGRYDVLRRDFLHQGPFLAVATIAPSHEWLLAILDATQRRPGSRIGEHQLSVIQGAFDDFAEADALHGGGHARRALAEYLVGRVLPMLRDVDPRSDTGAALFAAASEQASLLGWMAIDDDRPALGQRYLIQALRLAQESGDAALGAGVLVGMSHQALMLGYPREARQLAITGRHGLAKAYDPVRASGLWAAEAQAHAALGDTAAAVHAVVESERAFENIDTRATDGRTRFVDNAHLSGLWAEVFVELRRPVEAARFARRSISAAADQNRARREVLSQVALARAGVARNDLDTALRAAHRAVDLSSTVQSSRCLTALRDLRFHISPYRKVSAVREFDERARDVLTPPHLN